MTDHTWQSSTGQQLHLTGTIATFQSFPKPELHPCWLLSFNVLVNLDDCGCIRARLHPGIKILSKGIRSTSFLKKKKSLHALLSNKLHRCGRNASRNIDSRFRLWGPESQIRCESTSNNSRPNWMLWFDDIDRLIDSNTILRLNWWIPCLPFRFKSEKKRKWQARS